MIVATFAGVSSPAQAQWVVGDSNVACKNILASSAIPKIANLDIGSIETVPLCRFSALDADVDFTRFKSDSTGQTGDISALFDHLDTFDSDILESSFSMDLTPIDRGYWTIEARNTAGVPIETFHDFYLWTRDFTGSYYRSKKAIATIGERWISARPA